MHAETTTSASDLDERSEAFGQSASIMQDEVFNCHGILFLKSALVFQRLYGDADREIPWMACELIHCSIAVASFPQQSFIEVSRPL